MPGAFPSAQEETTSTTRTPKRRFVGRRTADAQAKERQDAKTSVDETTAVVPKGKEMWTSSDKALLRDDSPAQGSAGIEPRSGRHSR